MLPFAQQALFAPLHPLLGLLPKNGTTARLETLNAAAHERGLLTGSGATVRFVTPGGSGLPYEERVWWLGEIETRPDNWHDCFNALVWLTFPRSKAALNARHHQALLERNTTARRPPHPRGPLRDALTLFDECGIVIVAANLELWHGIQAHRWKEIFWQRRAELQNSFAAWIFGHASYDLLRTPHLGLCSKALFFHVDQEWFNLNAEQQRADLDQRLAQRFDNSLHTQQQVLRFQPLPLLGLPGATTDNEQAAYYDNTQQFRPLRLISRTRAQQD